VSPTIPHSVKFSRNGTAFVTNYQGKRLPEFEGTTHADTIGLLRMKGYEYRRLIVHGEPSSYPVRR
jgi:hypothetical protein